jgi:hypothetical protein
MAQILDFQAAALARSRCDPLSNESAPLVIVAGGGRDLNWPAERINTALLEASGGRPVVRLLHGGARGADRLIDHAARSLAWPVEVIPAEWGRYGRAAGPLRNGLLLRRALEVAAPAQASVLVIAFPGASGTASLVRQARHLIAADGEPIALVEIQPPGPESP